MMKCLLALSLLVGACGGNYSNEDIDFQLALPERQELTVKLPNAVQLEDSAEYYKWTRGTVVTFNYMTAAFLGLIDAVRAYPATERHPGVRVWGPFANDKHPAWVVRVTIIQGEQKFLYLVEYNRAKNPLREWGKLITGEYSPRGGVRRGAGSFDLFLLPAREVGYPIDGLDDIDELHIQHQTLAYPVTLSMQIGYPAPRTMASYDYSENMDGSGAMRFKFPTDSPGLSELELRSQWKGSGIGRADATVTRGNPLVVGWKGVDCWGLDTRATYKHRDWEPAKDTGDPSSCAFGPP